MADLDNLMDFAARTAESAGVVTLEHFGDVSVEFKGDGSEVTAADHAAEAHMRAVIQERFPDDGMLGEEGTSTQGTNGRRWILDPIDGTRSFASGVPLYGILLALEVDGAPVLGCCHFPALRQTLVAATGAGAWFNGQRAGVSKVDRLADARLVTSGLEYWRDFATESGRSGWNSLVERSRFGRTWGDCYGYMLIATGRADVFADPAVGAYWDFAPMFPIISEAGGRYTSLTGGNPGAWRSALATNGLLHEEVSACWEPAGGDGAIQIPEIFARQDRS
jgi:histidinol-phosphatase